MKSLTPKKKFNHLIAGEMDAFFSLLIKDREGWWPNSQYEQTAFVILSKLNAQLCEHNSRKSKYDWLNNEKKIINNEEKIKK